MSDEKALMSAANPRDVVTLLVMRAVRMRAEKAESGDEEPTS